MSNTKEFRVGLVGYGFMGRTHSNAYKRVGDFFPELNYKPILKAVCARNEDRVKAFAEQWGYQSIETDWRKLIVRDDIDA
ncbi:MAG: Gfo/Idh/MocA family oxidoreductase, partial [Chitinophagaceae bacterium]